MKSVRFGYPSQENGWVGNRELDVIGQAVSEPTSVALRAFGGTAFGMLRRRRGA